jgi:hypothetical protein
MRILPLESLQTVPADTYPISPLKFRIASPFRPNGHAGIKKQDNWKENFIASIANSAYRFPDNRQIDHEVGK